MRIDADVSMSDVTMTTVVLTTAPAFNFLVVLIPRTLTIWSVGSPAARGVTRAHWHTGRAARDHTAALGGVLVERCDDQAGVYPVARQVAVEIGEALAVLGNIPARSVSREADGRVHVHVQRTRRSPPSEPKACGQTCEDSNRCWGGLLQCGRVTDA